MLPILRKSDIKYDKGLVMILFYGKLERGLLILYVVQVIKPLLRSSVSKKDLITAVKERNLALGRKKQLKVYEVGGVKQNNSDNKADKIISAVDLLTK